MNIAVIGAGYVGLVTGTCLAETGNNVVCVDIDTDKVEKMKNGNVPIYEPHLDILFERNVKQGRLSFTTTLEEAVENAGIIFLALPTPSGEDGSADLSYVLDAADDLGKLIKNYKVIVNKSTVPVGTAEKVKEAIAKNAKESFDVVSNPEFLREGYAVDDFLKPERIIIGSNSTRAKKIMEELYSPFVRQGNPIIFMDAASAELTKYAANAFLAAKITFMNEIANLCERVGADVDSVRTGIGTDSRIGKRFLFAGIGYGGSCLPKDIKALAKIAKERNYDFKILNAVMEINERQRMLLIEKVKNYFKGKLSGKKMAIWGLAFKPDTDDIREAPALHIINALLKEGVQVSAFDPEAMQNAKRMLGDKIFFAANQYKALDGADALLIATEWPVFRTPDFAQMQNLLKEKVIFDGRNLYDIKQMKKLGFYYYSVGRETVKS